MCCRKLPLPNVTAEPMGLVHVPAGGPDKHRGIPGPHILVMPNQFATQGMLVANF